MDTIYKLPISNANECENANGGCEGSCCNTIGSFYCKCPEGSRLADDGKACMGEKRRLLEPGEESTRTTCSSGFHYQYYRHNCCVPPYCFV
uniref:EGF-like calcium-binding domain-containing protein n=1 Tax=Denticeps clupeoides TaxID=299321 RepID=A0AAY4CQQ2_9TELE